MTHILTLETLIAKGACYAAQQKFSEIFPNGAALTVEAFVNVAAKFDWSCAARLLLTPRNQVKFENTSFAASCVTLNAACDAYDASCDARDAARATYDAYCTARDGYNASCDARASYDARDAYNAARASCDAARATYDAYCTARDTALATAFATLYIEQEATS